MSTFMDVDMGRFGQEPAEGAANARPLSISAFGLMLNPRALCIWSNGQPLRIRRPRLLGKRMIWHMGMSV